MTSTFGNVAARLQSAIGADHVVADSATLAQYAVDEILPAAIAKPDSAAEVAEIVRFAFTENLAIIPCGNRTKLAIGMPPSRYDIALDITGLHQIAHYDPADLTLSVDAGIQFNDFAVPLYKQKQFLPLPVPFYYQSTIGGIIASGVDSALRHSYGTARDFLIGAEFVNGSGALTKSGGRVVKNVTGYDFHKLLIGSLGSLAIITRLNFRTFPMPIESRAFVASFSTADTALGFSRLIAQSPLTPTSIELLSPQLLQLFLDSPEEDVSDPPALPLTGIFPQNSWHLAISIEGTPEVCDRYARDLTQLARDSACTNIHIFASNDSRGADLWNYIGQAIPLLLETSLHATILKIALLPTALPAMIVQLTAIADRASLPHFTMARASGIIYFALLPAPPASADEAAIISSLAQASSAIFELCARESASASLQWCPTALKHLINVWGSAVRPDSALMHRLKSAFDPQNILAPGRLLD
jgi:glycolate oxidase FAD binding subunit